LVPEEGLWEEGMRVARQLASAPSRALAGMKANLLEAPLVDLEASMDAEVARHKATGVSADHVNAVRAFVEKRPPHFSARWTG
jgi:2-(1,2-epoxy-1,2-dihydrophenyl)acetyl-CoA isomerase